MFYFILDKNKNFETVYCIKIRHKWKAYEFMDTILTHNSAKKKTNYSEMHTGPQRECINTCVCDVFKGAMWI
jgi:hypothetical protein